MDYNSKPAEKNVFVFFSSVNKNPNLNVITIFCYNLIRNPMEFYSGLNQRENSEHNHITLNMTNKNNSHWKHSYLFDVGQLRTLNKPLNTIVL